MKEDRITPTLPPPKRGRENLEGYTALVTSGPTHEPIDPVRYLGNISSGKQGHAIAEALAKAGAKVTLISGPVALADPANVKTQHVTTAREMHKAVMDALPVDIAICAAAVADWRVKKPSAQKLKKKGDAPPILELTLNPDILKSIARHKTLRPQLVIGFAAETRDLEKLARAKRKAKGCDWILANDVANGKAFGADSNSVTLITEHTEESWEMLSKHAIAEKLVQRIADSIHATDKKVSCA